MRAALELCRGRVWHRRTEPVEHGFDYGMRMLLLDLGRLQEAFVDRPLCSLDGRNLISLHRQDYLDGSLDLLAAARHRTWLDLGFWPAGRCWLLTQPRLLGLGFNPVSFFLLGAAGEHDPGGALDAMLVEVSNTPWGERHVYALDCRGQPHGLREFEVDKTFHVSPFMPMEMRYRFRFDLGSDSWRIRKENWQGERRLFVADLELQRQQVSERGLAAALAGGLPSTLKVVAAIYWQALRLWRRGVPIHPHPSTGKGRQDKGE